MAITNLVLDPEQFTPSANGAVFLFNSQFSGEQTFNYIVDVSINQQWIRRDKLAPDPATGLLMWNAKSISGYLTNDDVTVSTTSAITPAINTVQRYDLDIGVSYSYLTYSAISSSSGSITFALNAIQAFAVNDDVTITPNASDPLNIYSGTRQVTGVPTATSITIAGDLSSIPADQTGRIGRADGTPIIITGITPAHSFFQFKSAIPVSQYFNYDQDNIRVGNSTAKLGTNMPRTGYTMRTNGRLWIFNVISANDLFATITTYDQTGTQLGQYQFLNPYDVATTKAIYARCGPQDLTDAEASAIVITGSTSIITDSVASYTVQWRGGSPFFLAKSDLITINLDRSSKGPECPTQLLFQDQRGTYSTALCHGGKRVILKTDKQTFKKRGFELSASAPFYITDQTKAQHTVFSIDLEQSFATSAVSRSKEDAAYFHELFLSTEVYEVQSDGGLLPVVVFEGRREAVNPYYLKGPIRWNLEYSYAFDQPLNV